MIEYWDLIDSIPLPLFVLDNNKGILFASRIARKEWAEELNSLGKNSNFLKLFSGDSEKALADALENIQEKDKGLFSSCEVKKRDGRGQVTVNISHAGKGLISAAVTGSALSLKENQEIAFQLQLAELIAESAPRICKHEIEEFLGKLGGFLDACRVTVLLFGRDYKSADISCQWKASGAMTQRDFKNEIGKNLESWAEKIKRMQTIESDGMSSSSTGEAEKSSSGPLAAVPLKTGQNQTGLIVFEWQPGEKKWLRGGEKLLRLAGEALANEIEDHKIKEKLVYDRDMYKAIIDATEDLIFLKDEKRRYLMVNRPMADLFGKRGEDIVGKTDYQLLGYEAAKNCEYSDGRALESGNAINNIEKIEDRTFEVRKFQVTLPGGKKGIGGHMRDISKEVAAIKELNESEEKYRLIVENQTEMIDKLDNEGRIIFASPSYYKFYGNTEEEVKGRNFLKNVPFEERNKAKIAFDKAKKPPYISYSLQSIVKDGRKRWISWINKGVLDKEGNLEYIMGSGRDITEQKIVEQEKDYLSLHDPLTALYNRNFIMEEMTRAELKQEYPITLIMADINGLKLINASYGQEQGDHIISSVARLIDSVLRKGEIVARWGGDEFAILLSRTNRKQAEMIMRRIKRKIKSGKFKVPVSLTFGIATKISQTDNVDLTVDAGSNMRKEKLLEKSSSYSSIITSLESLLRERDYETEEHVKRMKKYALKLAESLALSDDKKNDLLLAIALHDIGKVSVPDHILLKPGKLSSEEWEIMEKHSETGFRIARATPDLQHVARDVLHHHEKWDGTGYPKGLKGEKIPLISRIVSIVDAFDAMTSDRPYRKAMSKKEAVDELRKTSGSQFDPVIVKKFIKIISK